ncbi:MAG: hypothetical protein Q8K65_03120 [Alphaproteobacteria bacterium]|nr:hypothetical protein [Alphaproteobacteria bacterium]
MGNDFWEEYKKRAIYGDALGPPRNATEMAADNLVKQTKQPPSGAPSGGAYNGGVLQNYNPDFRFSIRGIIIKLVVGIALSGTALGIDEYISQQSILQHLAFVSIISGGIFLLWSTVLIAVNVFNFTISRLCGLHGSRALRYSFFSGIAGYFIISFFIKGAVLSLLLGFIPAATIGFFVGRRRR